jgi:hypothetical protein
VGVPSARPLLGWFSTAKFHSGGSFGIGNTGISDKDRQDQNSITTEYETQIIQQLIAKKKEKNRNNDQGGTFNISGLAGK